MTKEQLALAMQAFTANGGKVETVKEGERAYTDHSLRNCQCGCHGDYTEHSMRRGERGQ